MEVILEDANTPPDEFLILGTTLSSKNGARFRAAPEPTTFDLAITLGTKAEAPISVNLTSAMQSSKLSVQRRIEAPKVRNSHTQRNALGQNVS